MVFTGLVIMGALISLGYEVLLLAGAVGGVLSRLQRELVRRDVPSDYGLSWSVLFLSPVSGALSAWAGVLLLQSLQRFNVIDLAQLLPDDTDLTDAVRSDPRGGDPVRPLRAAARPDRPPGRGRDRDQAGRRQDARADGRAAAPAAPAPAAGVVGP